MNRKHSRLEGMERGVDYGSDDWELLAHWCDNCEQSHHIDRPCFDY